MTLKQALAILAANDQGADGSFVQALNDRARFDPAAFWTLYTAMTIVARAPPSARGRLARRRAHRVYAYILKCMIWHFSPHDGCRIRGLPERKLPNYLNRLEWVFDPVTEGKPGYDGPPDFGDGLRNPHKAALKRGLRGMRKR